MFKKTKQKFLHEMFYSVLSLQWEFSIGEEFSKLLRVAVLAIISLCRNFQMFPIVRTLTCLGKRACMCRPQCKSLSPHTTLFFIKTNLLYTTVVPNTTDDFICCYRLDIVILLSQDFSSFSLSTKFLPTHLEGSLPLQCSILFWRMYKKIKTFIVAM